MILARTVYLTSEAALCILFVFCIFFFKSPSILLFCYSHEEFKIGIMYMTYLLHFIRQHFYLSLRPILLLKWEVIFLNWRDEDLKNCVLFMGLSTMVMGRKMNWRTIVETGQVKWKEQKEKMVEMETLNMSEKQEIRNEKWVWNEEIEIY